MVKRKTEKQSEERKSVFSQKEFIDESAPRTNERKICTKLEAFILVK